MPAIITVFPIIYLSSGVLFAGLNLYEYSASCLGFPAFRFKTPSETENPFRFVYVYDFLKRKLSVSFTFHTVNETKTKRQKRETKRETSFHVHVACSFSRVSSNQVIGTFTSRAPSLYFKFMHSILSYHSRTHFFSLDRRA